MSKPRPNFEAAIKKLKDLISGPTTDLEDIHYKSGLAEWEAKRDIWDLTVRVEKLEAKLNDLEYDISLHNIPFGTGNYQEQIK